MWLDDGGYIVPEHVTAVFPKGKNGSEGSRIWLVGGGVVVTKMVTSQVVALIHRPNLGPN